MSSNKRERSRDREEKGEKAISDNKTSSSESKKDSNDSSISKSYCFQIEEKEESINAKKISISRYDQLKENISNIESPCILKNEQFINKLLEYKKENETFIIPNSFFLDLKKDDVIYISQSFSKIPEINNSLIFNSKLFDKINEKDKDIFDKFHNYLTAFSRASNISDFCYNKNLYFPYSYNDIYYEIERKFSHGFRVHHYDNIFGNITHHFGIKGIGKSICSRSIIYNYLHFKRFKGAEVFFPSIFFNFKLIKENLHNKPFILDILKYETINLFRTKSDWIKFYEIVNSSLNTNSVMSLINQIASLYISKYPRQKFLVIIDEFSTKYDEDKDIISFKQICKDMQIFDIFIIYSIENINDQQFFIQKYIKNTFIQSEKLDILSQNYIRFENKEVSCYYKYEYRNYNLLQKNFQNDIPKTYYYYFGDNISYYFQYKSLKNISFEDFVNQVKDIIAGHILEFLEDIDYSNQKMYDLLSNIISNENKIMGENIDLFNKINGSYFIFYKFFDINNNLTYKYVYAFPLIRIIYEDLRNSFDSKFFIDIKNSKFLELDGISMGVCFDNFMNWWFKRKAENKIFEFNNEEIQTYTLKYLIKKNTKNISIKEMYNIDFLKKEINENKELREIQIQNNILSSKKCIIIFQDFNAKSIDILFIIKNNDNKWILNSLQIKCSDNFHIDEKLLFENKFEMTYLRNKIKLVLGLDIIKSYITYISIYEKPKKCAEQNKEKFFYYNIKDDRVVDKNNQELSGIPFYEECRIFFVDEDNHNKIMEIVKGFIYFYYPNLNFRIIPSLKGEIIINGIQINNSITVTISQNEIILNSIIKNENRELKNKYDEIIFNCENYYKIIIQNFN